MKFLAVWWFGESRDLVPPFTVHHIFLALWFRKIRVLAPPFTKFLAVRWFRKSRSPFSTGDQKIGWRAHRAAGKNRDFFPPHLLTMENGLYSSI
jgi:hypothetical protein